MITTALFLVGIFGFISIGAMKSSHDKIYFGSFIPTLELNNILHIYDQKIILTIQKAREREYNPSQFELEISEAVSEVEDEWKSYASHFKRDYEKPYINYTDGQIKSTNNYFLSIAIAISNGQNIQTLNEKQLEEKIANIHQTIKKLIAFETAGAATERKLFLSSYHDTILKVGLMLLLVILGVILITYVTFKSIQNDHQLLEKTTKKLKISNKRLENASYTDSLTMLFNRRYFNLVYDRELKRAKRADTNLSFLMIDIDYFKQYNDTYGHIEGDNALKAVAMVLRETLKRPTDFSFRLGGEEFGVLLSESDETTSAKIAADICENIRRLEIEHKNSKVHRYLTLSIGIASYKAGDITDDEMLIKKADEMLYRAKESGRNRYVLNSSHL